MLEYSVFGDGITLPNSCATPKQVMMKAKLHLYDVGFADYALHLAGLHFLKLVCRM